MIIQKKLENINYAKRVINLSLNKAKHKITDINNMTNPPTKKYFPVTYVKTIAHKIKSIFQSYNDTRVAFKYAGKSNIT